MLKVILLEQQKILSLFDIWWLSRIGYILKCIAYLTCIGKHSIIKLPPQRIAIATYFTARYCSETCQNFIAKKLYFKAKH